MQAKEFFNAWKAWLACELVALGTACSPDTCVRAYSIRDWKGERSENTLAWSEAEAVALESPTAVVERAETGAGTP